MAVTNRYDTFKKYSKEQINSMKSTLSSLPTLTTESNNAGKPSDRVTYYYANGERISQAQYINFTNQKYKLQNTISEWNKQSSDYNKAFGSSMLEGSNVSVGNASVSVNEVPVDRTDPILDTTSTPRKKKRGDGSASALGL